MRAIKKHAPQTSVITALGSHCIIAPLNLIAARENLHLRMGGYGASDQSTTLALDRLKRLKQREQRIGVQTGDVTFVEITSRTVLRHGDRIVDDQHLFRIAPKAMGNTLRAAEIWRAVTLPEPSVRANALAVAELGLAKSEISQLAKINLTHVSPTQMKNDLSGLKALAGTLIVALPYLAIENPKGVSILRNRLAGELSNSLGQLNIAHFDPGELIGVYGQNLALKNPANLRMGYTDGFVRMLAAHLSTHYLSDFCRQVSPITQNTEQPHNISASGGA